MSEKTTKKIRRMARLFYSSQPLEAKTKTVEQIYQELKTIHKNKKSK